MMLPVDPAIAGRVPQGDRPLRSPCIPTGVGNTYPSSANNRRPGGSSPRAWGTRSLPRLVVPGSRFIPTGVGNTSPPRRMRYCTAVHPHGRGEHNGTTSNAVTVTGSSPRAWGTQRALSYSSRAAWFIPTGVGNTSDHIISSVSISVHPHGRGEHLGYTLFSSRDPGSSPRAWGTLVFPRCLPLILRFIPTGVGNTRAEARPRRTHAVHPHGRGEHAGRAQSGRGADGSSPRAWGTLSFYLDVFDEARFIPTGVGNTLDLTTEAGQDAVHPHGRGEHSN